MPENGARSVSPVLTTHILPDSCMKNGGAVYTSRHGAVQDHVSLGLLASGYRGGTDLATIYRSMPVLRGVGGFVVTVCMVDE